MNITALYKKIPALLMTACVMTVLFTSCKKDAATDTSAPAISYVTTTLDYTTTLDTASLSDWVMIHGSHLAAARTVKFNSVTVADADWYANDTTITVKISSVIADTINNLITVVTPYGTATYGFVVKLPAPVFSDIKPGIANAGATVVISGNYLSSTKTVKFGSASATIVSTTDTTVSVIVPSGANGQYVTVTTSGGAVTNANMFGANYVIYDDALNSAFYNGGWSGTTTLGTTDVVLRGTNAITRVNSAWGAFALGGGAVDLSSYKAIKLSVYGGSGTAGKLLKLILQSNSSYGQTITITEGSWTTYTLLLSNLGSPSALSDIWLQEFSGSDGLTVYIDDIVLL